MKSIKNFTKSLNTTLSSKFNGSDLNLVQDFLSRFVENADMLKMNGGQAYLNLPIYLNGTVSLQLRANAEWIKIRRHLLLAGVSPIPIAKLHDNGRDGRSSK